MTTRLLYYSDSPAQAGATAAEIDQAAKDPCVDILTFLSYWGMWEPTKGAINQKLLDGIQKASDTYGKPVALGLSGGFNVMNNKYNNVPHWVYNEPGIQMATGYAIPGSPGTTKGRTIEGPVPWIGPYQQLMKDAQSRLRDGVMALKGVKVIEVTTTWAMNESSSEHRLPNGNGKRIAADGTPETNWYQMWLDLGFTQQLGTDLFTASLDHMANLWPDDVQFDFHFITGWAPGTNPIPADLDYAWATYPGRLITCYNQQPKIVPEQKRAMTNGQPIGGQMTFVYWADGQDKTVAGFVCDEQSFKAHIDGCQVPDRVYYEFWPLTVLRREWSQHIPITPPPVIPPTYAELQAENDALKAEVATLTATNADLTTENAAQQQELDDLAADNSSLSTANAALQVEIDRLKGLIEGYNSAMAALVNYDS